MKRYPYVIGMFFLSVFAWAPNVANAQAAAEPGKTTGVKTAAACEAGTPNCKTVKDPAVAEGDDPFRGLKWGVGVAFTSNLGGVGNVTVDNNKVVRVTKENSGAARGAFELHYFFKFCNNALGGGRFIDIPRRYDPSTRTMECEIDRPGHIGNDVAFGMGPFVSLNTSPFDSSSGSKIFDSIGAGWMIGLNAYDAQKTAPTVVHSLNVGIGAIIDTSVRTLAPGVVNGQPTTITDQSLLTTQSTKTGWMVMMSYKLFDINLK